MPPASKAIVFTDFDGTITLNDSNDYLTDNVGFGWEMRRKGNIDILENRVKFRDAFKEMLDSVKLPFEQCINLLLKNVKLDPGFATFYEWCLQEGIPVVALSSGMEPVIRALLTNLIGPTAEKIKIVSNQVKKLDNGEWTIEFHDDSDFGHDKSLAIRPSAQLPSDERPILFYCGDGVSDLSAARETDLLFAKVGRDLITYCEREGFPFAKFESFEDIHRDIKDIVEGRTTTEEVASRLRKTKDSGVTETAE